VESGDNSGRTNGSSSDTAAAGEEIIIGIEGAAGVVMLNRPAALNALTTPMRAAIAGAFSRWGRDPQVYAAVIAASPGRAFCAGGDVRETTRKAKTRREEAVRSLAEEYTLNWQLDCFSKPTVPLIDGIVMGSGVGISLYGTHRVAGERYRFAMPETAIGLFPDDGVSWAFARMPDAVGMYLALTGKAIGRADAFALGLVTHCIGAPHFGDIRSSIAAADPVDPLLDGLHEDPGPGELEPLREPIARCFSAESVEAIMERLRAERGAAATWAEGVANDLAGRSPTSLKITHRLVRLARGLDLRETLRHDFRLACRCLDGNDFHEGVRAVLVDRDRSPKWVPQRLEDVSEAMLEAYFAPLGDADLELPSRAEMQGFGR
jgi:enoyl-CoA hydratase